MAYKITELISHKTKFAAMVSFNDRAAEYYEVDSLDESTIHTVLSSIDLQVAALDAQVSKQFEIDADGKLVIPEPVTPSEV